MPRLVRGERLVLGVQLEAADAERRHARDLLGGVLDVGVHRAEADDARRRRCSATQSLMPVTWLGLVATGWTTEQSTPVASIDAEQPGESNRRTRRSACPSG